MWSVVAYQARVARRAWRAVLVGGLVTPLLYVLALGVGLGAVVDRHGERLDVPYVAFVAPALLTASALQVAAAGAAYPMMSGFKWTRVFHGMTATPLSPRQIADGELAYLAIRLTVSAALYLAVIATFGGARSWWSLLAVPAATLTGLAFAAPVAAIAASTEREGNLFNLLFRFVVTPMFLFSGTFYPISRLPEWGQVLAWISPLWHGTQVARDAALGGGLPALTVLGHVGYLLGWLVAGLLCARWRFRVRLTR